MTTQPTECFWQGTILRFALALSRPSTRQEAAGQRWAACIVTLPPPDPASAPSRYGSFIRNALHTGQYRGQLGSCILAVDWDGGLAICSQLHALEVMGYGDSGDHLVTRVQVEMSCQQLVRQLTAMADPTAAGALSIQVHIENRNSAVITTPQVPAHSGLACGINTTGNRKLRGSLLALGQQPIPGA